MNWWHCRICEREQHSPYDPDDERCGDCAAALDWLADDPARARRAEGWLALLDPRAQAELRTKSYAARKEDK